MIESNVFYIIGFYNEKLLFFGIIVMMWFVLNGINVIVRVFN